MLGPTYSTEVSQVRVLTRSGETSVVDLSYFNSSRDGETTSTNATLNEQQAVANSWAAGASKYSISFDGNLADFGIGISLNGDLKNRGLLLQ